MGTTGMVAQAHGLENYDKIVNLVFRNIAFVILISLLLIFFQRYIFIISLNVFELSSETTKYFKEYFELRIYSSFGELMIYIITGYLLVYKGQLYQA